MSELTEKQEELRDDLLNVLREYEDGEMTIVEVSQVVHNMSSTFLDVLFRREMDERKEKGLITE